MAQPPCSGPPPLPSDARVASAAFEHLRFGVFRRMRSLGGADVFPRGLPTRGARPIEQVSLAEALARRWEDDRHIVLYTSSEPYRVNNGAVGRVRVEVRLLAIDVDNHDDAPGWLEGERAKIDALLAAHPGGFVHTTRRGWRALYALPSPVPIRSDADKEAFALYYARTAAYLFERFGIIADDALTRWNQPIRLPHVVREGRVFDAEIVAGDAHAIGVFALPDEAPSMPDLRALARVLPRWGGVAKRWQPKRDLFRVVTSAAFDHVPLSPYSERVAAAAAWAREQAPRAVMGHGGRATARSVAATLHVGFALERDDVERILTGSYNRRRCSPPWGEHEVDDLRGIARAVARTPVHPWGFMLTRDRTGVEAARTTLAAAAAARNVVPLADVGARIVAAVEQHRAVVVRATYGAGKTHAMSRYIATRTNGRVIVVVPRHELGRAWVDALAAAGETDVAYHASVVQRRDDEGRRHCDNKIALKLYARGGDVARDVCPSCPRAATCPAYAERPSTRARVHVLPREVIPKLGITADDLVVFDDAAVDLLAWHRLAVRSLRRLAGADPRLLPREQRRAVVGFVQALLAGPRQGEAVARAALGDAATDAVPGAALRTLAARAVDGQRAPYVASDVLAEGGDELEATLRDAGTLRDVLRFAGACADGAAVHWSDGARSVHGETAAAKLLRAHAGRLVLLDAAANVEELRALRPDLHVERIDVDDAGDAKRVLLFAPTANRAALRDESKRRALLDAWVDAVVAQWRARRVRRPVIVTYKALVPALRAHPALAAWAAERPGRCVRFAHYGAVRGSNRFRRVDAVVTVGDPWLNGDDVLGRAAWLALPDEPAYRIALATAELGQAHGRSRSVRRRRRLTHVHVGRLVPDGWAAGVDLEPLGGPPERTRGAADRGELAALVTALGGNRGAAAALGCSSAAIAGWRGGRRGIPRDVLLRLRALVVSAPSKASASSGEAARGGRAGMDAPLCKQRSRGRVHGSHVGSGPAGGQVSEETVMARPQAALSSKSESVLKPPRPDVPLRVGDDLVSAVSSFGDREPPRAASASPSLHNTPSLPVFVLERDRPAVPGEGLTLLSGVARAPSGPALSPGEARRVSAEARRDAGAARNGPSANFAHAQRVLAMLEALGSTVAEGSAPLRAPPSSASSSTEAACRHTSAKRTAGAA